MQILAVLPVFLHGGSLLIRVDLATSVLFVGGG